MQITGPLRWVVAALHPMNGLWVFAMADCRRWEGGQQSEVEGDDESTGDLTAMMQIGSQLLVFAFSAVQRCEVSVY